MLTSRSTTLPAVSRSARIAAFFVRTKSLRRGPVLSEAEGSRRLAGIARRRRGVVRELGGEIRRVTPQALQSIEAPAILGEHVHDEIAVVEQDPTAGRRAFD